VQTPLYQSTADHYAVYQIRYPDALYEAISRRFGLDGTQACMDLGCGPGIMSIPMAALCEIVYAVDPAEDMLRVGEQEAVRCGYENIAWIPGSSSVLPDLGTEHLDLVVMGKSFHWMDRTAVLDDLDVMVKQPHGGIVIAGPAGTQAMRSDYPWEPVVARVRADYLGDDGYAGSWAYVPDTGLTHRKVLESSAFSVVEEHTWDVASRVSVPDVAGMQLSRVSTSPAVLGDRVDGFVRDVTGALMDAYPSGWIDHDYAVTALFATRPPLSD
jgi:2-polyprenyl-3-methyl-5-hydroxy-6-metoxy-1,4-benzoquinol methylase